MGKATQWIIRGKIATQRDLMEAMQLARQHRAKRAQADREARDRDAAARRVAASIRKGERTIRCRSQPVKLKLDGTRRLNRLEQRFGLAMRNGTTSSAGGVSSFHFKLTARGLGSPRRSGGRPYRRREIIATLAYILRLSARETDDQGIESNISVDPDKLAAVFGALEELEITAGRDNANVYMSLIVSLPAELTSPQRKDLLAKICGYLADRDLAYAGIQHKPDPIGDQRNFHAHIVFSWRPMTVMHDGCAFAADTLGALNTPEFVTGFRAHAALAMNAAMQAAGHERRFTADRTRAGPGSSVADKKGSGRKHHERRAEQIAAAERARAALQERQSALGAAMEALQGWATRVVPDRRAIMAELQQRQSEIMAVLARGAERVGADRSAAYQRQGMAPEPAISHEKPVTTRVEVLAIPPSPTLSTPSIERQLNTIIPLAAKETDHAERPDYASALREVRRFFAAREPDRRKVIDGRPTDALSGVRGLSSLGLAGGLDWPQMLLHGLSSDQLGDAAGPVMGSGDGLRRPRDGDRATEGASGADALSVAPVDPVANVQSASVRLPLPEPDLATRSSRVTDASSGADCKRPQEARSSSERADKAVTPSQAPSVERSNTPKTQAEPTPVVAAAAPAPSSSKAAEPHAAPLQQNGSPPIPSHRAGSNTRSRVQVRNKVFRPDLLSRLAARRLPLRELTRWEEGRERTVYSLVLDKALPEDAGLIEKALSQQFAAAFQELFQRQFEELLADVRAKLMARPSATAAERAALLNPANDRHLSAALAAAEGSPSLEALVATMGSTSVGDELSEIDRHWLNARRGAGYGE